MKYTRLLQLILLASNHVVWTKCEETEPEYAKFLVLGAGIAGLTAAKNLADHNQSDFLILEGDSRIGGRVKSQQLDTWTVELGSQLVSGSDNPIRKLADRVALNMTTNNYGSNIFLNENGDNVTDTADERSWGFLAAYRYMMEIRRDLRKNERQPDVSQRVALSLGGWMPRDGIDYASEYCVLDYSFGHQPETTSTRHMLTSASKSQNDSPKTLVVDQDGGLFKVIQRLHDDVLATNDARLRLNHVITNISYSESGVVVTTVDGKVYRGDYVIITFSLGVLQNEAVTFDPPLPDWKRYAIKGATFVSEQPIYLIFPPETEPFWNDNKQYMIYASERRGFYTVWQNTDELIAGSRILRVQLTGDEARRVARMSDSEVKEEMLAVLRKMYKVDIPYPQIVLARWSTDPLHYGSFTDWAPYFSDSSKDALRSPVGRLYFAGEAYDKEYFGTLEGAFFSAMEETNRVMECALDSSRCVSYVAPYEAVGCTYKAAINYDADAQIDDGSCRFDRELINDSNDNTSLQAEMTLLVLSTLVIFILQFF